MQTLSPFTFSVAQFPDCYDQQKHVLQLSVAPNAVVPLQKRMQAPDATLGPDVRQRVVIVCQCIHFVLTCSTDTPAIDTGAPCCQCAELEMFTVSGTCCTWRASGNASPGGRVLSAGTAPQNMVGGSKTPMMPIKQPPMAPTPPAHTSVLAVRRSVVALQQVVDGTGETIVGSCTKGAHMNTSPELQVSRIECHQSAEPAGPT